MSCNFSHRFFVTVVIYVIFRVYVAKKITLTLTLTYRHFPSRFNKMLKSSSTARLTSVCNPMPHLNARSLLKTLVVQIVSGEV